MIEIQTILTYLGLISIPVGVVYHILTLRNQSRTRQAQLFMQLFDRYLQKTHWRDGYELLQMEWTDLDDFFSKYDSSVNMDNFEKRYRAWSFFDGMGMLLKKGLVDREMIYYLMGGYGAYWSWEKFKDVIIESRKLINSPDHFAMFEYLAEEMRKMKEIRSHDLEIPSHWSNFTKDRV
jgi:hypothetical protein